MKVRRLVPALPIVLVGAVLALAAPARAQLDPFAALRDNVARAAAADNTGTVEYLVGTGNNPNATHRGYTALHYAAMFGNTEMIAALVKAGARVDALDRLGNTPLCLAAARRQDEAARLLITAGADVNAQNHDGMTPLMAAAEHGDLTLVRFLLAHGADPRKHDYTGRSAANWAEDSHRPTVLAVIQHALAEAKR
jgi:ankyrin repeat protein